MAHLQLLLHIPLQAGHVYEGSRTLLGSLLGLPLLLHVGSCLLQLQDLQLRLHQAQQVDQGCVLLQQTSTGGLLQLHQHEGVEMCTAAAAQAKPPAGPAPGPAPQTLIIWRVPYQDRYEAAAQGQAPSVALSAAEVAR